MPSSLEFSAAAPDQDEADVSAGRPDDMLGTDGQQQQPNKKWTRTRIAALVMLVVLLLAIILTLIPASRQVGLAILSLVTLLIVVHYLYQGWFLTPLELLFVGKNDSRYCCCELSQTAVKYSAQGLTVVLVVLDLLAVALEGTLTTQNGVDPHPLSNGLVNLVGATLLMAISLWIVDGFLLLLRLGLWCRLRVWYKRRAQQKRDNDSSSNSNDPITAQGDKVEEDPPFRRFPILEKEHLEGTDLRKHKKLRFGLTAGLFLILLGTSLKEGLKTPTTERVDVEMRNLPDCLDGFTIGVLADLHAGPTVGRNEMKRHVSNMNALQPDVICVVGDLVDGTVSDISSLVEPIRQLTAPYGVYYSVGNHEHYYNADEWRQWAAETAGLTVLHNTMTRIEYDNDDDSSNSTTCVLEIAGVDDQDSSPDYTAALSNHTPGLPLVLLAHQPVQTKSEARQSQQDLIDIQLSGHSHGGQIWPLHSLALASQQGYIAGLYRVGQEERQHLYVTQGVVGWGPRMRFGSRTEYTLLMLRSPEVNNNSSKSRNGAARGALSASVLGWIGIGLTGLLVVRRLVRLVSPELFKQ